MNYPVPVIDALRRLQRTGFGNNEIFLGYVVRHFELPKCKSIKDASSALATKFGEKEAVEKIDLLTRQVNL